jgi:hypothetical protein
VRVASLKVKLKVTVSVDLAMTVLSLKLNRAAAMFQLKVDGYECCYCY